MPPEPDKKIEETLRAYAQQRRAQAGQEFALHPAARKMLQGEVARTFPGESGKPIARFIFWPRFALIGSFTALLVATVLILNTPKSSDGNFKLAKNSEALEPIIKPMKSRAIPPPASRQQENLRKKIAADKSASEPVSPSAFTDHEIATAQVNNLGIINEASRKQEIVQPPLASNPAKIFRDSLALSKAAGEPKREQGTNILAAASPNARAFSMPSETSQFGLFRDQTTATWWFAQPDNRAKYRENLLSPKLPNVLQKFQIMVSTNGIVLRDSDGSIYKGKISQAPAIATGKVKSHKTGVPFSVNGTNLTLRKAVSFTGELSETNSSPAKSAFTKSNELKARNGTLNHVVHGKISINGTNEFEIRAIELP